LGIKNVIHQPFFKNKKSHKKSIEYYDNEVLEKVNLLIKEDLENFGYLKIENI
jgi:hypothetical protein